MIRMEEPAYVWNACDIYFDYNMWWTFNERPGATLAQLIGSILGANVTSLARKTGPLRNIIFNCHGFNGGFHVGGMQKGTPVYKEHLSAFGVFRKLNIGTIWFASCELAKDGTGQNFCQMLAQVAGTQVIASNESQLVGAKEGFKLSFMRRSYIDDFEGSVFSFTPKGGMQRIIPERDVWTIKT